MRSIKAICGAAAMACALGAFASPAFAVKEKLKFGEFEASIAGRTISESSPAPIALSKEGSASVSRLKLGGTLFGFNVKEAKPEPETPCLKEPSVKGAATEEKSTSLLLNVTFRQCMSWTKSGAGYGYKAGGFKLGMRFIANESAEIGEDTGLKIEETAYVKVTTANKQCLIAIPAQFVPAKAEEKEEKFWEGAEYSTEKEAPVENWEKSKKLQEQYPGNFKNRLFIETTEKFKHIVTYVDTVSTGKPHGCTPVKGEANTRIVTEEGPWKGWTEHTDGEIFMEMEGLEVKGGQLAFIPPA